MTSNCYYFQVEQKFGMKPKRLHGGKSLEYIESCLYLYVQLLGVCAKHTQEKQLMSAWMQHHMTKAGVRYQ